MGKRYEETSEALKNVLKLTELVGAKPEASMDIAIWNIAISLAVIADAMTEDKK